MSRQTGLLQRSKYLLEVCVDAFAGLEAAIAGGAGRIELCSALELGGLTPSVGLMEAAAKFCSLPVHALIRPRGGDFVYSDSELDLMERDIYAAREVGLAGVVIGVSAPDKSLDRASMLRLMAAGKGLDFTLHRAFDLVPDFDEALLLAIELGFSRILTSGGARCAGEGLSLLQHLAQCSTGRISIMPGGGITAQSVLPLLELDCFSEFHGSCSCPVITQDPDLIDLGFTSAQSKHTDARHVRALVEALL